MVQKPAHEPLDLRQHGKKPAQISSHQKEVAVVVYNSKTVCLQECKREVAAALVFIRAAIRGG
ncbi:MAG: hypothetical protein H5T84_08100 [Thermoleophilia bacterium]|nr:hypothetical protein [Thermoleophilia bacterium]